MRDNEKTATTLWGKLDSMGALVSKGEPLHSRVPRSNHELNEQQEVNLVSTAASVIPTSFVIGDVSSSIAYIRFVHGSIVN